MQTPHYPEVPDDFGNWLAGFIDGEGSFQIARVPTPYGMCYGCRLAIILRDDDEPVLREVMQRTGCGTLHASSRRTPDRPAVRWAVNSKSDCTRMAEILDRCELRSKKARDYVIWREGIRAWAEIRVGGPRPQRQDWSRMAELRDQLIKGRKYRP